MPPPVYAIVPNDMCEITTFARYKGQQILSVFHYRYIAAQPGNVVAEFSALYEAVVSNANSLLSKIRACQVDDVIYDKVRMQIIYPLRRPYDDKITVSNGTRINVDPAPPNVAAVINKQTDIQQRGRTGSLHIAGMNSEDQANGVWTAAYITALTAVANAIPVDIPGAGVNATWTPYTWSRSQPGQPAVIIGALPMSTVRVMRRRTVGVGI